MDENETRRLEARLEYLEEVNRFTIEALEMAASLGNFQSSINRMHDPSSILKETREKMQRLLSFSSTAFFLVDEDDSDFYLFDCDPETDCHFLQDEVDLLIDDGTFARALLANRPFIVYSRDLKKQLLLHVMATTSRVRGMFVGVLSNAAKNIPDVSLGLLSIVMLNSANTLESFELYRKIGEFNQELQQKIEQLTASEKELMMHRSKLEQLVAERTSQLQGTVSHLNQEIGERRKTEERLRQSQELLENIFHAIPDLLSLQDRDLHVIMSNSHNGHGAAHHRLEKNTKCYEIYAGRQLPCEPCPAKDAFATGRMSQLELSSLQSGTVKEIRAFPIRNDKGEVVMVAEHMRDITEKKKLEDELLKVQKLESVGILAGGVAHDFNNILTAIMGNISLALMDSSSFENIKKRLGQAEKSCLRARDLTMQLLTFSRGGDPVKKPMRIRELLQDSTIFASHGSGIKCKFEIADDLLPVEADESQISQVMSNLVINACQAMPNGGVLEIKARNVTIEDRDSLPLESGRYIQLLVKDHGMGIPSEHLPKIFDPYFSTKSKGNGLGLAVVFSIIKRHGGIVQANSSLGHGSVFTVYLPAVDGHVSPQKHEPPPKLAGKGRVLVMDDEEIVRETAREMLTYIGYDVGLAEDGVEAIQLYLEAKKKGTPFDAVIMDLTIPGGMGGKQAIEKLKELDDRVKAVVSSGYSNDPTMANHELYGFKGIVAKPYNLKELNDVLHRVISVP